MSGKYLSGKYVSEKKVSGKKAINIALIISSLILGSLITVVAYPYFLSNELSDTSDEQAQKNRVLYWYDPMYPATKFDQPGKSPFMDMDLMPKYAEESDPQGGDKPGITINPAQTQNLGLKTTQVIRGHLSYNQTFPATISFNDYQFAIVQPRAEGFVEKVFPITIGDEVKKGEPLVELTIPQWVEGQSEYVSLRQMGTDTTQLQGILERLRLAGMPAVDIIRFKSSLKVQTRFTINAPLDGVITALDTRQGMNIGKSNVIAQIQGTDPLWINASLPESIAHLLNDQAQFSVSIPAYPEKSFVVNKWTLLPSADMATRTLNIRAEINNPNGSLKPGMIAYLNFKASGDESLIIPTQSIVDTGLEQHVITLDEQGRFVPKLIKISYQSQQDTAISAGLKEGENLVTRGIFLIDSEANIAGALDRMRTDAAALVEHSEHNAHQVKE